MADDQKSSDYAQSRPYRSTQQGGTGDLPATTYMHQQQYPGSSYQYPVGPGPYFSGMAADSAWSACSPGSLLPGYDSNYSVFGGFNYHQAPGAGTFGWDFDTFTQSSAFGQGGWRNDMRSSGGVLGGSSTAGAGNNAAAKSPYQSALTPGSSGYQQDYYGLMNGATVVSPRGTLPMNGGSSAGQAAHETNGYYYGGAGAPSSGSAQNGSTAQAPSSTAPVKEIEDGISQLGVSEFNQQSGNKDESAPPSSSGGGGGGGPKSWASIASQPAKQTMKDLSSVVPVGQIKRVQGSAASDSSPQTAPSGTRASPTECSAAQTNSGATAANSNLSNPSHAALQHERKPLSSSTNSQRPTPYSSSGNKRPGSMGGGHMSMGRGFNTHVPFQQPFHGGYTHHGGVPNSYAVQSVVASAQQQHSHPHKPHAQEESVSPILAKLKTDNNYNPKTFDLNPTDARFFVIKSYSEDDVHRSIKYSLWCSTEAGNARLDRAFREQSGKGPIYLFFSVNCSRHFCGMAVMTSTINYDKNSDIWQMDDKWRGQFQVKWIYVKDVPNRELRNIRVPNNENKPVTHSRDTQELRPEQGKALLKVLHNFVHSSSLFEDFNYYERKQMEVDQERSDVPPPAPKQQQPSSSSGGGAGRGSANQSSGGRGGGVSAYRKTQTGGGPAASDGRK